MMVTLISLVHLRCEPELGLNTLWENRDGVFTNVVVERGQICPVAITFLKQRERNGSEPGKGPVPLWALTVLALPVPT